MTNKYEAALGPMKAIKITRGVGNVILGGENAVWLLEHAETIQQALALAAKVEAGTHVVVPVEPTDDMLGAAYDPFYAEEENAPLYDKLSAAYEAMIQAAKDKQPIDKP